MHYGGVVMPHLEEVVAEIRLGLLLREIDWYQLPGTQKLAGVGPSSAASDLPKNKNLKTKKTIP